MSKLDWKKEAEGNFPVFPSGTYKVRINSVKRTTSSKKGTPGLQWIAVITSPDDYIGRYVSTTTWTVESTLWRVAALVEACGITGAPVVDTESDEFLNICQACVGQSTYWRNEQRTYEGKVSNDIVDFQPDPDQSVVEYTQDADVPDFAKS